MWPLPANSPLTIACYLLVSRAEAPGRGRVGQNVRVRKLLIGLAAAAAAVVVGAVGADFGAAIYAEYRLARTLRSAAGLAWDPSVAILGFPFIPQAMRRHYDEVETSGQWRRSRCGRQGLAGGHPAFDRSDAGVVAGAARCQAAGRQGGEPHHHRLHPRRPVHGHQRPAGRGAVEGDQRRHRRHHRVGHLQQPRAGVHRHARRPRTSTRRSASRWTCPSWDPTKPRWCSPPPAC